MFGLQTSILIFCLFGIAKCAPHNFFENHESYSTGRPEFTGFPTRNPETQYIGYSGYPNYPVGNPESMDRNEMVDFLNAMVRDGIKIRTEAAIREFNFPNTKNLWNSRPDRIKPVFSKKFYF